MKNKIISSVLSVGLSALVWVASAALVNAQEPIAFIGHGVMFDQEGKQIQATPEFIARAQNYYIDDLYARLQPAQKKTFDTERARFLDTYKRTSDPQDALIISAALLDWLIKETSRADAGTLQGKNNLIKAKLRYRLFPPEAGTPYVASKELLDLLEYKNLDTSKSR